MEPEKIYDKSDGLNSLGVKFYAHSTGFAFKPDDDTKPLYLSIYYDKECTKKVYLTKEKNIEYFRQLFYKGIYLECADLKTTNEDSGNGGYSITKAISVDAQGVTGFVRLIFSYNRSHIDDNGKYVTDPITYFVEISEEE